MRKTFQVLAWTMGVIFISAAPACAKAGVKELLAKAEAGDAQAQYELGALYENGRGVAQDFAKALSWYEQAAGAGHKDALVVLGWLYQHGEGVDKDISKAIRYYEKAAEDGSAQAQVNLAVIYDEGIEVPADNEKALKWYNKAAGQGHEVAMLNLGVNYWKGKGVAQSYERAWKLLNQVRIGASSQDAQWNARAALDKIKEELNVTADRSTYPKWEDLEYRK